MEIKTLEIENTRLCYYRLIRPGDRVRIKQGYVDAGAVGYYAAKSASVLNEVLVCFHDPLPMEPCEATCILAEAIEAYPYTREERIERAIEDYIELLNTPPIRPNVRYTLGGKERAVLYAILDAGV